MNRILEILNARVGIEGMKRGRRSRGHSEAQIQTPNQDGVEVGGGGIYSLKGGYVYNLLEGMITREEKTWEILSLQDAHEWVNCVVEGQFGLFTEIGIVSPTRGVPYTVGDALNKFRVRGYFKGTVNAEEQHCCFYGSQDWLYQVSLGTKESEWFDSLVVGVSGGIPVHFTADGRPEWGYGCGCDRSYGGQFPPSHGRGEPENERWDDYKESEMFLELYFRLPRSSSQEEEQTFDISIERCSWGLREALLELVKEHMFRTMTPSSPVATQGDEK